MPGPVDIVDIFRNPAAAHEVVREAIALKDKLGIKVIWMQLGVRNEAAAEEAEAAGLKVVMNRCTKIEYGRLSGEIGWAGVNVGILSAKRPLLSGRGVQDHVIAGKRGGHRLRLGVQVRPSASNALRVSGASSVRWLICACRLAPVRPDLPTNGARGDAVDVE